jgi:hypothetical protein
MFFIVIADLLEEWREIENKTPSEIQTRLDTLNQHVNATDPEQKISKQDMR